VPGLKRGGPPTIDLPRLERELNVMLDAVLVGDFLRERVPEGQRRLIDIAFSGNGEPTSATEFHAAVEIASRALATRNLLPDVILRLITNGSLLDRRGVREGVARMGAVGGEVWFKVDAGSSAAVARINGSRVQMESIERRLKLCGGLCSTWVQTCLFARDGQLPSDADVAALAELLGRCRSVIRGVHLYGLARPSAQPDASRLTQAPAAWLDGVAARLKEKGLTVTVSP
jgi:wyosine [tRNA(Phe)-imidazoG37] synthetase (radical SAM superfamily)